MSKPPKSPKPPKPLKGHPVGATHIIQQGTTASGTPVVPPTPTAPTNTVAPIINRAVVGQVSTCSPGTWTGSPTITFAYQWKVAGVNAGTNSATYTPVSGDNTKALTCVVTASNGTAPDATATSNSITVATSGGTLDIPDTAAFFAAASDWPTTGNKTWQLSGGDYGPLGVYVLGNYDSAPVVVDGLGTARIEYIDQTECSGIYWKNCIVYGQSSSSNASIWVHQDSGHENDVINTGFENMLSDSGSAEGTQVGAAYQVRNVNNGVVTITGRADASAPDIQGRTNALAVIDCNGAGAVHFNNMTVTNNGQDGIIVTGSTNVTINANLFRNFYWEAGAHPDAIQFFSSSGNACENIVVTNNLIEQGIGQSMQGIFMENVVGITIQNNAIHTGVFNNAISMSAGGPALIDNNFAQGIDAPNPDAGGGVIISRGGTVDNTVTNNTANTVVDYTTDGTNPGYTASSNTIIAGATGPNDWAAWTTWYATHNTSRNRV